MNRPKSLILIQIEDARNDEDEPRSLLFSFSSGGGSVLHENCTRSKDAQRSEVEVFNLDADSGLPKENLPDFIFRKRDRIFA
jgi:hypothetical protein